AKHGTTILLASHLLDEVEKVCSHVIVIRKIVLCATLIFYVIIEKNNTIRQLKPCIIMIK
ncbi:MAG: hypothetical protein ABF272_08605, partial [Flavobacteriales bacterium]